MKILLVSSSSGSRGGGEIFLRYLGQGLAELGHQPVLWCSNDTSLDELATSFAPIGEVIRAAYTNTYQRPLRLLGLAGESKKRQAEIADSWRAMRPDVLHINKQNLEDAPDLLGAATLSALPTSCTIHITQSMESLKARFGRTRDRRARTALRASSAKLIAVGDLRADELEQFAGREASTIYNGVPIPPPEDRQRLRAEMRKQLGLGEADRLILCVGRLMPQKDPVRAAALAEKMAAKLPGAHLAWAGDGPLKEDFATAAASFQKDNRLHLPGWVDDVTPWLAAADLFLHTARFEGLPLAILEAFGFGLPAIIPQYLEAEASAITAEIYLPMESPEKWLNKLSDAAWVGGFGERAAEAYDEHFSTAAMATAYLDCYQQLLTTPQQA